MAIFGCILTDECVQENDRLRISVEKNSVTPDEDPISMVEVDPDGSGTFFDVSDDLYLDWEYPAAGSYTATLRVTAGANSELFTKEVAVKTAEEDCLFASDDDLKSFEPDIYNCLECYRCSFKYIHRQVNKCIMDCLFREGLLWDGCAEIDIAKFKGSEQLRKWASYWALELIFMSFSKAVGDFYDSRAKYYAGLRQKGLSGFKVYFDKDGDGNIEQHEYKVQSNNLITRW